MPAPSPNRPTDAELRRLYIDEEWSAQQIADQAKVRKITALRWLKAAGIERRIGLSRTSLAARGITPPTAAELVDMVHIQHLSYREIAALYGVDYTAVPHWLKQHGIERPSVWATRRKGRDPVMPTPEEARALYEAGESTTSLGQRAGVSQGAMARYLRANGVPLRHDGWQSGKRWRCQDGHEVRSSYEQRVDDWLHEHGIAHELEPAYPWDRRYLADFKVGDIYIEVWGVSENEAYTRRRAMKMERCAEAGLDLISINHWQFAKGRKWWKPLLPLITPQPAAPLPL